MPKKVLIIEDDQIVAGIYKNRLQVEGFVVELSRDGEQGIAKLGEIKPDLVVLDLMLPKINGVEVIKHIRAHPDFKTLPIIVFSNSYLSSMVQDAWKAGANTCLSKVNSTPRQVLDVIRNTLGTGSSSSQTSFTSRVTRTPAAGAAESAAAPVTSVPVTGPSPTPPTPIPISAPIPTPAPTPPTVMSSTPISPAGSASSKEAAFLDDVRKSFLASGPNLLTELRECLSSFIKASEGDTNRSNLLFELYRKVHAITSNAGVSGFRQISEMTIALEALLKELYENPKNINPSTLRTVAQTIDFLNLLFQKAPLLDSIKPRTTHVLVVDDEIISRRAITFALEKAHLKATHSEDGKSALLLVADNHYDLVVLDVDMPEMTGFQLCAKLRALPEYQFTPVIFVTGLTDFESRAKSTLSGGNDFIAKPFLFMELAVKALTHVLRGQIQSQSK